MAQLDTESTVQKSVRRDGEVRCGICASTTLAVLHEWCPAEGRLICDECCHRMLIGDVGRNMAALFSGVGYPPPPTYCSRCERGQTWLAGEVLDAMANEDLPS